MLQAIDPRMLQINLTGFLEKNTSLFVKVRLTDRQAGPQSLSLTKLDITSPLPACKR